MSDLTHIDYGDIIYDQPNNDHFCSSVERVQYNAALAITGAIKGTSQQKIYQELGFESLRFRRWFRCLCIYSFIPYTIVEWNKLDADIKNAKSYICFRNHLLKIGRPIQNSIYKIFNPFGN